MPGMSKAQAIERLERQAQYTHTLFGGSTESSLFLKWERDTLAAIRYIFGETSHNVKEFDEIRYYYPVPFVTLASPFYSREETQIKEQQDFHDGLHEAREALQNMIAEIKEYWTDAWPSQGTAKLEAVVEPVADSGRNVLGQGGTTVTATQKQRQIHTLSASMDQIDHLEDADTNSPEFSGWVTVTQPVLASILGENFYITHDFARISFVPAPLALDSTALMLAGDENYHKVRARSARIAGLRQARSLLIRAIQEVNGRADAPPPARTLTRNVFVVHGHDDALRESTARLLERLGLQPIILAEQEDRGHTIIEKFEAHSDVGVAIVLLTPDDMGASKANSDSLNPRARQNVILELGYFVGKLGRSKVLVLLKDHVEKPSDWDGVLYIPVDRGDGWRYKVGRGLRAAGLDVDLNKL